MKKVGYIFALLLAVCFVLTGCTTSEQLAFEATTLSIYDFYTYSIKVVEEKYLSDINAAQFTSSDKTKIQSILDSQNISSIDELAIVAAVDCFNLAETPKEGIYDFEQGIIHVSQQNRIYSVVVTIGSDTKEYNFEIAKDTSSANYNVTFRKNNKECKAVIEFDTSKSILYILIDTYSDSGIRIQTQKEVVALTNKTYAFRAIITEGVGSSSQNDRKFFVIECYKEQFENKIKISKVSQNEGRFNLNEIAKSQVAVSNTNDIVGYEIKYSFINPLVEFSPFGNPDAWVG